jgi:2-oxoglutarate ferredoxin oxidoreductase subunit alpha
MYNILLGGAAGQGVYTTTAILEKLLKRAGYRILTVRDFMSRIRGGHNFSLLRFGPEAVYSHDRDVNAIVALDEETYRLHESELLPGGFILCDSALAVDDPRAVKLDMGKMAKALGNPRVAGSIAIGAVLKMFGEGLDGAAGRTAGLCEGAIPGDQPEGAEGGLRRGGGALSAPGRQCGGRDPITGSRAVALGALAAGLSFYAAYPMSPPRPSWSIWPASRSGRASWSSRRRTRSPPSTWPSARPTPARGR